MNRGSHGAGTITDASTGKSWVVAVGGGGLHANLASCEALAVEPAAAAATPAATAAGLPAPQAEGGLMWASAGDLALARHALAVVG